MMQAVHFGAGNIGRGFIGLLLYKSGYQVSFADVNEALIQALKERQSYTVKLVSNPPIFSDVHHVSGYHSVKDLDALNLVLLNADLITTAVGPNILPLVAKSLVASLEQRAQLNLKSYLNIIACENTLGGSDQLKAALYPLLSPSAITYLNQWVGFPNSAVDRIVPNQKNEDILLVKVEPFYEWAIDTTQIKGELKIEGAHFTNHLEAYIERKLFTVNTGHASAAYAGYLKGYQTVGEAMMDPAIESFVSDVIHETGAYIIAQHGFDPLEQEAYIQKTLERFKNPNIVDEVTRVGRSPLRKLSKNDRFIKPLLACQSLNLKTSALEQSIANLLRFNVETDDEAVKLQSMIQTLGYTQTLIDVSGLSAHNPAVKNMIDLLTK